MHFATLKSEVVEYKVITVIVYRE